MHSRLLWAGQLPPARRQSWLVQAIRSRSAGRGRGGAPVDVCRLGDSLAQQDLGGAVEEGPKPVAHAGDACLEHLPAASEEQRGSQLRSAA